ncbi:hypothetical protein Droror1_Dr00012132 [Drosera rotundifolia]
MYSKHPSPHPRLHPTSLRVAQAYLCLELNASLLQDSAVVFLHTSQSAELDAAAIGSGTREAPFDILKNTSIIPADIGLFHNRFTKSRWVTSTKSSLEMFVCNRPSGQSQAQPIS